MDNKFTPYIVLFLLSVALLFIITPHSLGISPDSIFYLESARNILKGLGHVDQTNVPIVHWPPGYPIMIALFSWVFNLKVIVAALYANILIYFFTGFYLIKILKAIKINAFLQSIVVFLLLASIPFTVFKMVWSEGFFILLLMISHYYFLRWTSTLKSNFLIVAGLISALFIFVRYAGIGFICGYIICIFLYSESSLKKIKNTLLYSFPIVLFFIAWHFYKQNLNIEKPVRELAIHLIQFDKIKEGFRSFITVFIEYRYIKIAALGSTFFLGSLYILYKNKEVLNFKKNCLSNYPLIVIPTTYLAFLFLSISFFDSATPLNSRILAPIFPYVFIFIGITLSDLRNKIQSIYLSFLLCFMITITSHVYWKHHYKLGSQNNRLEIKQSEIYSKKIINSNRKIYTNSPFLLFHPTIENIYWLPKKNTNLNVLKNEIKQKKALIIFDTEVWENKNLLSNKMISTLFKNFDIEYYKNGFVVSSE